MTITTLTTLIAVSLILLVSLGGSEKVFAQTTTSTMNITQLNLPTITFPDTTVDIVLNDTGKAVFEFQSLIDDGTITIENQGANNIRFEFDSSNSTINSLNRDTNGVIPTDTFTIPTLTEGHTVLYNGTHLEFDFDNPNFLGTTPSLALQVSLHELPIDVVDNNPFVDVDVGNTIFNIIPPICETTIGDVTLDFGTFSPGDITNEGTIAVENTGNVVNNVTIGADNWCPGDDGCTISNAPRAVILNTQTRFSTSTSEYAEKTPFEFFVYTTDGTNLILGGLLKPFLTPDLFTLQPSDSGTAYLQTEIELRGQNGFADSRFMGNISQVIFIGSECG